MRHLFVGANPGASRYAIQITEPGTHYFAIRAYTSGGAESASSGIVVKTVL